MGWWKKAKNWIISLHKGGLANQSYDIVPCQVAICTGNNLPLRGAKRNIDFTDDVANMFRNAPPEIIQCVLEGRVVNVRGKSLSEVSAMVKRDTSILGATFTITAENGEERGKVMVWRNGQIRKLDQQKSINKNAIRQIGR